MKNAITIRRLTTLATSNLMYCTDLLAANFLQLPNHKFAINTIALFVAIYILVTCIIACNIVNVCLMLKLYLEYHILEYICKESEEFCNGLNTL